MMTFFVVFFFGYPQEGGGRVLSILKRKMGGRKHPGEDTFLQIKKTDSKKHNMILMKSAYVDVCGYWCVTSVSFL